MSLPPLAIPNLVQPQITRNDYIKFKTSHKIKMLNPLIPYLTKNKPQSLNITASKPAEITAFPAISPHNSKVITSRLSPVNHTMSPPKRNITYLKKKYLEYMAKDRYADSNVDFTRPIRDYFKESGNQHKAPAGGKIVNGEIKEENDAENDGSTYEVRQMKPRYSPLSVGPKGVEKREKKEGKASVADPGGKSGGNFGRFVNQSLQTDANSFEFDEWEFDYDA